MARIAGVDLPRDKRVELGVPRIYGNGRTSSNRILAEAGVNSDTRCRNPSQKRTSCSWSEDKDECKNKKRSEENSCKQKEII